MENAGWDNCNNHGQRPVIILWIDTVKPRNKGEEFEHF